MSTNPVEVALAGAGHLGRSFRVVSVLPGLTLVFYVFGLLASRTADGRLDLTRLTASVRSLSFTDVAILVLLSFIVGLVLHPLQFGVVQLLEGYWGPSMVGRSLIAARSEAHRRRWRLATDAMDMAARALNTDPRPADRADFALLATQNENERVLFRYPEPDRIMPTALGNVLRRHEDLAGSQYGLTALVVIPHLALIAPKEHLDYLDDRRNELDGAVRFCLVWALCAIATVVVLWSGGRWLLVGLVPYALSLLSYHGAVGAASHYGHALSTLIDLNRFRLYEHLGVRLPVDSQAERLSNRMLMALLQHRQDVNVRYDGISPRRMQDKPQRT